MGATRAKAKPMPKASPSKEATQAKAKPTPKASTGKGVTQAKAKPMPKKSPGKGNIATAVTKKQASPVKTHDADEKHGAAMAISGQDEELSNMVMNIKPTHNNMWKDAIEGPCPPELNTE